MSFKVLCQHFFYLKMSQSGFNLFKILTAVLTTHKKPKLPYGLVIKKNLTSPQQGCILMVANSVCKFRNRQFPIFFLLVGDSCTIACLLFATRKLNHTGSHRSRFHAVETLKMPVFRNQLHNK